MAAANSAGPCRHPRWLDGTAHRALGIRLGTCSRRASARPAFEAHVDLVEPVGNEVFVNLRFVGQPLVARMPPQVLPEPGQGLRVTVENAVLHCFDPDGLRLG